MVGRKDKRVFLRFDQALLPYSNAEARRRIWVPPRHLQTVKQCAAAIAAHFRINSPLVLKIRGHRLFDEDSTNCIICDDVLFVERGVPKPAGADRRFCSICGEQDAWALSSRQWRLFCSGKEARCFCCTDDQQFQAESDYDDDDDVDDEDDDAVSTDDGDFQPHDSEEEDDQEVQKIRREIAKLKAAIHASGSSDSVEQHAGGWGSSAAGVKHGVGFDTSSDSSSELSDDAWYSQPVQSQQPAARGRPPDGHFGPGLAHVGSLRAAGTMHPGLIRYYRLYPHLRPLGSPQ